MKRKYILLIIIALLAICQFIRIDKVNPPIVKSQDFINIEQPSTTIAQRVQKACYDCHSNTTQYPWYSDFAPVSWWLENHIKVGRNHLNFSTWGEYSDDKKAHKMEEAVEYTHKEWMPIGSYVWMHPEAKMSKEERGELVTYFKNVQDKY